MRFRVSPFMVDSNAMAGRDKQDYLAKAIEQDYPVNCQGLAGPFFRAPWQFTGGNSLAMEKAVPWQGLNGGKGTFASGKGYLE